MRGSALIVVSMLTILAGCSNGGGNVPDAGHDGSEVFEPCEELDGGAPSDVFCIGLYEDHDPSKHALSAHAYTPGVVLWSDGAEKQRYLYLPPSTEIDTSDMDAWTFPVGTKAFKEFRIDGKLVETRLMWKRAERDWLAATYIWNDAETGAALNASRMPVIRDDGYEIPTARDCGKCHHGGSDTLLGVEAVALGLPTADGMTLSALVAAHLLSDPPPTTEIETPEDSTGHAAFALGYLHANCGMPCHSSRGLGDETQLLLRLRATDFWPTDDAEQDGGAFVPATVASTDAYQGAVNEAPTTASVAQKFPGASRIVPGDHEQSLLWLLSHRRGLYQMPPLVSHRVDEAGTQQLADWIDALPP
jgi:hypothetical protein